MAGEIIRLGGSPSIFTDYQHMYHANTSHSTGSTSWITVLNVNGEGMCIYAVASAKSNQSSHKATIQIIADGVVQVQSCGNDYSNTYVGGLECTNLANRQLGKISGGYNYGDFPYISTGYDVIDRIFAPLTFKNSFQIRIKNESSVSSIYYNYLVYTK